MHDPQALVRQFHEAFDLGAPPSLSVDEYPGELRVRLIEEELDEFREAVAAGDVVEMIDALCDLLYVTYGAAVSLGVDLEPFFAEVHRSNMDKRGGAVRSDGKKLKPSGWQPPQIETLIRALYADGLAARVGRIARSPTPAESQTKRADPERRQSRHRTDHGRQ